MPASCTLTVFFEDPFWVGLVERQDESGYSVAKHVFGAEPSMPEIEQFALYGIKRLRFASALTSEDAPPPKPEHTNPKRQQREAKKALERNPLRGTYAQQVLAQQREDAAQDRKEAAKLRQEEEKDLRFEQRSAKRKEKHKGH